MEGNSVTNVGSHERKKPGQPIQSQKLVEQVPALQGSGKDGAEMQYSSGVVVVSKQMGHGTRTKYGMVPFFWRFGAG